MNAVIVFIRDPERGFVKTRIAKVLGDDFTLELYNNFIKDILKTCEGTDSDTIIMFLSENSTKTEIPFLKGYNCYKQEGTDLGERMYNAFLKVFDLCYERCCLIGSDIPDVPAEYINQSFKELDNKDIVLGPSYDGGYYLIAMKKGNLNMSIFKDIEWSTDRVLKETLNKLNRINMTSHLLGYLNDIDNSEDLLRFYSLHKNIKKRTHTMKFLSRNTDVFK